MEDKESKLSATLHSFRQKKYGIDGPFSIQYTNLGDPLVRFRSYFKSIGWEQSGRWILATLFNLQLRTYGHICLIVLAMSTYACDQPKNEKSGLTIDGVPVSSLFGQGKDGKELGAVIQLNEEKFDFDTLAADEIVEHNFKFKNAGDAPLLIASVKSTCGCTVPSWPEEVIKPGEFGDIAVSFDASGRSGRFIKTIQIRSNGSPPVKSIRISGFIESGQ